MIEKVPKYLNAKKKWIIRGFEYKRFEILSFLIPKKEFVVILAGSRFKNGTKKGRAHKNSPKIEDNAIAMANYIAQNSSYPVYFIAHKEFKVFASDLLHSSIHFVERDSWAAYKLMAAGKYLFFTHQNIITKSSPNQIFVNLWHGVGHKRIGKLKGPQENGVYADFTVVTSKLTRDFFAKAFAIPDYSAIIVGYPRNDWMLKTVAKKEYFRNEINDFIGYEKVIIWMPTFRANHRLKGNVENIFSIEGFNLNRFQEILAESNTLCLIKPHHFLKSYKIKETFQNIKTIDDFWIYNHKISLYQLLACTDALITDYSSVMIDYCLLDNPIFCIATDLEDYKKQGNLYFEDYENWIPTQLYQNQRDFFAAIDAFLKTGEDRFSSKRKEICDRFFTYKDAKSSDRIMEQITPKKSF